MLYTCATGCQTALSEIRAARNDTVAVSIYEVTKPVKVAVIAPNAPPPYLNAAQAAKQLCINDFLHDELTRQVAPGSEHLYRISRAVARECWRTSEDTDGWLYPSVKSGGENVGLLPDRARKKLRLISVLELAILKSSQDGIMIRHDRTGIVPDGEEAVNYRPAREDDGYLLEPQTDWLDEWWSSKPRGARRSSAGR